MANVAGLEQLAHYLIMREMLHEQNSVHSSSCTVEQRHQSVSWRNSQPSQQQQQQQCVCESEAIIGHHQHNIIHTFLYTHTHELINKSTNHSSDLFTSAAFHVYFRIKQITGF